MTELGFAEAEVPDFSDWWSWAGDRWEWICRGDWGVTGPRGVRAGLRRSCPDRAGAQEDRHVCRQAWSWDDGSGWMQRVVVADPRREVVA